MTVILAIEHIAIDPEKRGGRPHISGTGITVHDLASDYNNGMTAEEMGLAFDLTLGQVYAALSYYFDHKAQIDQEIHDSQTRNTELLQN